jgi:choline dehydrogenase
VTALPAHVTTVVAGGGTSGAALAGTLVEASDESVLVVEAGPDFGAFGKPGWPPDLIDARILADSYDWGYDSGSTISGRVLGFARARVVGGCSSHNGCAAIVGSRLDYDGWEALGCSGWGTHQLAPVFASALDRMRVRRYSSEEITPFQQVFLDAAPSVGLPLVADLNEWSEDAGIAASPVNVVDGVRWNAAFAYLDPVRDRPSLRIVGDATVVRVVLDGVRAVAVEVLCDGLLHHVECDRVVLTGGAYGSPGMLERSGVGDPEVLRAVGVDVVHALPGVGANLHDHPAVKLTYAGGPDAHRTMVAFAQEHYLPEEQVIAKAASRFCDEGFDLHLYPVSLIEPDGSYGFELSVAGLTPASRGAVHIRSADAAVAPLIDHRYCSDPGDVDRAVLVDGVRLARALAAAEPARSFLGPETDVLPANDLIDARIEHYYHPVGSCRMGAPDDPLAVVDSTLRVRGLDNLFVADCSVMPVVPRGNTNLPAVVVGLRAAQLIGPHERIAPA